MRYLYLHGFLSGPASGKSSFLKEKLAGLGISLAVPDLNRNDFRPNAISRQLEIIRDEIKKSEEAVVLIGSSLGGFLAACTVENNEQVAGLVLLAPALNFVARYKEKLGPEQVSHWKDNGSIRLFHYHFKREIELDAGFYQDALKYEGTEFRRELPVKIFHGIADESVPWQDSIQYLKANREAELILLNSDHSLFDKLEVIWNNLKPFIQ